MSKILVSGAQSGIGKYICEELNAVPLTRDNHQILNNNNFSVIIHCANNRNKFPDLSDVYQYYLDNLNLTQKLVSCKHKKFIYFSTIEVYPSQTEKAWKEDDNFSVSEVKGVYPFSKIISEEIVENEAEQHLILRISGLLGKYTKPNITTKIMSGQKGPFSLSGKSTFNFVLYEDVFDFIKDSIDKCISGTFNVVSSENIDLIKIASLSNNYPIYGNFRYDAGHISNEKIIMYKDPFQKSSEEILKEYWNKWN
jgi:dTDP-4-dehydrorhamnose reductase